MFVALPPVSRYGQVARPYALVAALAAVAGYLLVRALAAGPGRGGRWLAGYGAALAGLGLANVFGLLLIPAHLPLLLLSLRRAGRVDGPGGPGPAGEARKLLWGWLAAVVAACVVVSPVVVLAWAQRYEEVWVKPVSLKEVTGLAGGVRPALVAGVIVVCVVVAGAARGRARLRAGWPAPLLALAVPWLLLPAVLLLAGSLLHPSCCLPVCGVLHRGGGARAQREPPAAQPPAGPGMPGPVTWWSSPGANDREFQAAHPARHRGLGDIALGQTAISAGHLPATGAPTAVVRTRLATVTRLRGAETGAGRGNVPVLAGPGFHPARRWDVTGIWLVLHTRR